ncbi:MAG: bifunctional nuclease family protein [Dehalococcoidales bacterium]|nr:bifunctional nuclease family protein [Dehalococcoidales bacterium]
MAEKTDIELVELARQGDKDAFGVLAKRYQLTARRFAMRLVANEDSVQELAQEAMLQAYLSLSRLRDPARFKSWLCGIVLNVCRSHLRDRKIDFFSLEAIMEGLHYYPTPLYETPATLEQLAEEKERYLIVFDAVNALPAADRDVILLFYYAQLNLQEIVKVLNIPVSTIKVRLHRARLRLKVILQEKHPEIVPEEKRRKIMVRVTIADVVKKDWTDKSGLKQTSYIIVLCDESGKRALLMWIDPIAGQAIAAGLSEFSTPRPLTFNFLVSLIQSIGARVEQVRIESLKNTTFYGVVRISVGKKVSDVDARPSDAIALAVRTGSPIYVAENVLEKAGLDVPGTSQPPATQPGVEAIIGEMEDILKWTQSSLRPPLTKEAAASLNREVMAAVFK